jgi:hypothetical protein
MKKIYIFALTLAMVAVSCQKDVHQEVMHQDVVSVSNDDNGYAVSVDEALANLDRELDFIYGASTRSGDRPNVRKVHTLHRNAVANATRSGEVNAEELLYIVEFDEGQGSAILGADDRLEDVYAVLEDGVISLEDFENARSGGDDSELSTYLAGLILDEVEFQLSDSPVYLPPVEPAVPHHKENDTLVNKRNSFYVRTKWYQGSPYNNECVDILDPEIVFKAGCGPIAVGQILAHNQKTGIFNIGDNSFDMSLINCKIPWGELNQDPQVRAEVARFIHQIGIAMGARYGTDVTLTNYEAIAEFFTEYAYTNVLDVEYDFEEIVAHMDEFSLPLAIYDEHHGWVIDGYYWTDVISYIPSNIVGDDSKRVVYLRLQTVKKKLHCNFGYAGNCDGYYSSGIFDLTNPATGDDIVPEIGDYENPLNVNLGEDLKIVYYNLN